MSHMPESETVTATDVRQHFASVINRVARKEAHVLIEKSDIPLAGIVSADDMDRVWNDWTGWTPSALNVSR